MKNEDTKIKITKLNLWYGDKKILHDIDIGIDSNTITALIGPSGCGKSTLLRCINRMNDLIPICKVEGSIIYTNGKKQNILSQDADVVTIRKNIGMLFQKPNPFPMSIYDNVAYGLKIQGIKDKKEIDKIVRNSLVQADLYDEVKNRMHTSAFKLSGGQQQRLCIARALAINPNVLLLDEPCSALDPISTAKIEELLLKLKMDRTIIIVTHNMQQAKRISDYSCYLLDGKVIEYDSTLNVFNHPKNILTKKYINGDFG
ncbi:MAG: phosphate ABC transporter ATP-binding protein PstB [Candidatus Woesearchaeota archaeon]